MNSPYKGKFKVSQRFKGNTHKGLDLVGIDSKTIYSTVTGTVKRAGWNSHSDHKYGMGIFVKIKGEDGFYYYFAHMSKLYVNVGDKVVKGDVIGVEGNTGHSSGSHLHYEVREKEYDNTSFLDINAISGIPNEVGVYKEVEDLTKEETIKVVNDILNNDTNDPSTWIVNTGEYIKAKSMGITDGSRPKAYITREEAMAMIVRAVEAMWK